MARIPVLQGVIKRRILVNFRVDPAIMQRQLPDRFRPKLHDGQAIAGVCLIRLEHIRPRGVPSFLGMSSENAAHRVAVLWDENGESREGVYILRRDTGSAFNAIGGGRLFPGEHHRADFQVRESTNDIALDMQSRDKLVEVHIAGAISDTLPTGSAFPSLEAASAFFRTGSLGYSVTHDPHRLDGLLLETHDWRVEALALTTVHSSVLADTGRFPAGSVQFDHALLMRNIAHEWHSADDLYI